LKTIVLFGKIKNKEPIIATFVIDQVQIFAFQVSTIISNNFLFCFNEITISIRPNTFFPNGLSIHTNGNQQIIKRKTLSFNFSEAPISNFGEGTTISLFKQKFASLKQILNPFFKNIFLKKIEIAVDIDFLFFKDDTQQAAFFKLFQKAVLQLYNEHGFSTNHTIIHQGRISNTGEALLVKTKNFGQQIKSISIVGGFFNKNMITFCFYDKRYKHSFLPSDRDSSQWRFEITIHPQQMNAFFQDQPTSEFFLFIQHFVVLFRACDKYSHNHGVNMVLKALKIALKPYQKQNTSTNTKNAKNTQNNKSKEKKNNTKNNNKIQ
jgi:hypothetical protein